MAYTHSKYEVMMTSTAGGSIDGTTSGVQSRWIPGAVPHYLRRFSMVFTTSGMAASTTLSVVAQLIDLTSGSTASALLTLHGTASDACGRVIYKNATADLLISPGQMLEVDVTNASTSSTGCVLSCTAYLEPSWEEPGNNTDMVETPTA